MIYHIIDEYASIEAGEGWCDCGAYVSWQGDAYVDAWGLETCE